MIKTKNTLDATAGSDQQITDEMKSKIFCEEIQNMTLEDIVELWAYQHLGFYDSDVRDFLFTLIMDFEERNKSKDDVEKGNREVKTLANSNNLN
jgi:hypothetical protein